MAREDIVSGLRNAVERGYSIDAAVSSFINAGYKKEDVAEAAAYVGIAPTASLALPAPPANMQAEIQEMQKQKKSKKGIILVIALVIILLALLGVLAYLIFFKKLFG